MPRALLGYSSLDNPNPMRYKGSMSAVVRIAIGVVCLFGFTLAALLFFYAANPWMERVEVPLFGSRIYDTALFSVIGLLCVLASIRLIQGRTWAWWTAFIVSLITFGLGAFLFVYALYPRDKFARSEGGFGLGIGIMLMIPGTISSILLNLSSVCRRFAARGAQPTV